MCCLRTTSGPGGRVATYKVEPGWQSYSYSRSVPGGRIVYIQGQAWVASGLGGRIVYIQGRVRVVELFTYKVWPGWQHGYSC